MTRKSGSYPEVKQGFFKMLDELIRVVRKGDEEIAKILTEIDKKLDKITALSEKANEVRSRSLDVAGGPRHSTRTRRVNGAGSERKSKKKYPRKLVSARKSRALPLSEREQIRRALDGLKGEAWREASMALAEKHGATLRQVHAIAAWNAPKLRAKRRLQHGVH